MLINVSLSEQKHGGRKQTQHTLTGAFSLHPEDTRKGLKKLHRHTENLINRLISSFLLDIL